MKAEVKIWIVDDLEVPFQMGGWFDSLDAIRESINKFLDEMEGAEQ